MMTIRRLIYREVVSAVLFVAAGFLALFFFFDFVDELPNVGKGGTTYRLPQALMYVAPGGCAHRWRRHACRCPGSCWPRPRPC